MHALTQIIRQDMKPALGVTEPGAIAFAVAKARSYTRGAPLAVSVAMNSGIYKNAYTCGLPHSSHYGFAFAAALGLVAGDAELGLESLANITEADNLAAEKLLSAGILTVTCAEVTSHIYIRAEVKTDSDTCAVTIRGKHTNITRIELNGQLLLDHEETGGGTESATTKIHDFTLAELLQYCYTVPEKELLFLREAYRINLELYQEGLSSDRTVFLASLLAQNGGKAISDDEVMSAQVLCAGAIEARVIGLDKPAMSITGSGAHGIICTLPLYALQQVNHIPEDVLLRATALSYLITIYIKEYSGALSAYCGCGIAAGTGMACAAAWMKEATQPQIEGVIRNMSSSITGMICDGGNQGCTMKSILAVDVAFRSVRLAMSGASVSDIHGINAATPEDTFRQMGQIAVPGMVETELTILDILHKKNIV